MTKNKDLKKKIRARAAKTGESYTEARRNTLAAKPSPTEAMKRALEAWGVTIGADSKLTAADGQALKVKWATTTETLSSFPELALDFETHIAKTVMGEVFTALFDKGPSAEFHDPNFQRLNPNFKPQTTQYLDVGNLPPEKVAGFVEDVRQEYSSKLAVTEEALPDLPVRDVAPLLEVLKYLNSGDAHPTEIRIMVKGALEQFDRQYPKVLPALVDPDQVEDDEDWDVPAKLNGKDVMLSMKTTYQAIVRRAGMLGRPSMTYNWGTSNEVHGGILHWGEEIVVKPGMVFNVVHTNDA